MAKLRAATGRDVDVLFLRADAQRTTSAASTWSTGFSTSPTTPDVIGVAQSMENGQKKEIKSEELAARLRAAAR